MMRELTDIIQFENESTSLDFKAIQYKKEKFEALLTDFIAMANSNTKDDKYIIIGIKHRSNGNREIIGIQEDFIDEATYQQLIIANIEPEIKFEYYPFQYEEKKLAIFHFTDCSNPPYMMQKDYGKLKKGDSFIRKGTHQTRISRKDFDSFLNQKLSNSFFDGNLKISFYSKVDKKEITIKKNSHPLLPSDKYASEIKSLLIQKEEQYNNAPDNIKRLLDLNLNAFDGNSYESRSIKTLKENLKNIKKTYEEDDNYLTFEKNAHKINFYLFNDGNKYIEDSTLQITIKKKPTFLIVKNIFSKPENSNHIRYINPNSYEPDWDALNYPIVIEDDENYIVNQHIENIKHQLQQKALLVSLRIVTNEKCKDEVIELDLKIFAKNLQNPISEKLKIYITDSISES